MVLRLGRRCVGRMVAICPAFWALLSLSSSAQAQILNIEKNRLERKDDEYLVGNLGATFSYNNRSPTLIEQVRIASLGLNSNIAYFVGNTAYHLINDYALLNVNDATAVSTGVTHLRIQFERKRTLHYELYNQYQYDVARGLRARSLVGTNLRWAALQSTHLNLVVGAGPMFEIERWKHPFIEDLVIQVNFLKLNSYISARLAANEVLEFNAIVYYQVGHDDDLFRHRISSDANLSVKAGELFSITSGLSLAYETAPIVPIIPFIFSTTQGVRVDF